MTPTPGSLAAALMELGAPYMGELSPASPGDTPAAPKEPLTPEQTQQLEMLRTLIMPLLQPQQLPMPPFEQTGAGESSGGGGGSGESAR